MAALFSCSKCFKRYPFDELSQGKQLCKECRSNYPVVKCTYCRAEFQQNSKGSTSSICSKCAYNVKHYGKPTACDYCSVLAAFIGNRCQRCCNSEKKWGPPMVCEQCKLKCAFDRPECRKSDGKLMCWLCDQAYRRVLAKTSRLKSSKSAPTFLSADSPNKMGTPPTNHKNTSLSAVQPMPDGKEYEGMTVLERLTKIAADEGGEDASPPPLDIDVDKMLEDIARVKQETESRQREMEIRAKEEATLAAQEEVKDEKDKHRDHHRDRHHHKKHHHKSHHKRRHSKEEDESGDTKKQKSDKISANGALSTPKSTGSNEGVGADTMASENVILISQLREQIEALKKQMAGKDHEMMEKDKRISELKSEMFESAKSNRTKELTMMKSHSCEIEILQTKNRELSAQVKSLKDKKKDKKD